MRDAEDRTAALVAEVAKLRDEALTIRKENETLKLDAVAPPEAKIVASSQFRALAMEHQTLDKQHERPVRPLSRLRLCGAHS